MAVLKIHVIRHRLDDRLKYAINPEKTAQPDFPNLNGLPDTLTDAFNCYCDSAYEDMTETKKFIGKEGNVLGYHFIQSFKPGEVTPAQAHDIGIKFIERCFANDYQVVIGTHTDKDHIHMMIRSEPKLSPLQIARRLKQMSAAAIWKRYENYLQYIKDSIIHFCIF